MPKKFAKEDIQNWTDKEVGSWLHSKGLIHCLSDFATVNGLQLLSITNDDLKALPTLAGNEKKRKALKKALSQLPGNSVSKSKSKLGGKKGKDQKPPLPAYPPHSSSVEPAPAFQPHPPPLSPPSAFHHAPPPHSPNSATYTDPSVLFGDDEEQDLYDNPADITEDSWDGVGQVPPPLPPHTDREASQQGMEVEEQMIYDQYEEDSFADSSFASEEEEEEEEEETAVTNGISSSPRTGLESQANIRAISAKFFAEGLTAHTGIVTGIVPPPNHTADQEDFEDGDDIYDVPPDELKSHPPPFQPREDPADEADDEGDIYDIVEEVMQSQGQIEEEPPPPRPPKPSSPSVPRKEIAPPSPQLVRTAPVHMRDPIQALAPPAMSQPLPTPDTRPGIRPPIQTPDSRLGIRSPIQTTRTPSPPQIGPTTGSAPPPPPPPPPVPTTNTKAVTPLKKGHLAASSPTPPKNTHTNSLNSGGPDRKVDSNIFGSGKFPKPSEMNANKTGRVPPVPGQFVRKQRTIDVQEEEGKAKPSITDKPLSVQERIKLLKKPIGQGTDNPNRPPKPLEGVSPLTKKKMSKESSVSDLIKNYPGSSGGEEERATSPEQKPFLPPKPAGPNKQNISTVSPHLKRRPIGQHQAPPPALPDQPDNSSSGKLPPNQDPPWKRPPVEEKDPPRPPWQKREEPPKPSWQKREEPPKPSWQKREEPPKPSWQKRDEPPKPSWQKHEELPKPSWQKRDEPPKPSWQRHDNDQDTPKPSWQRTEEETWKRKMEAERKPEVPLKKVSEERQPLSVQQRWKAMEEEPSRAPPPWKQREETKPELPRKSESPVPPLPPTDPPRKSFSYKPYSDRKGSGSCDTPPPMHESSSSEHLPPPEPPRPKVFQRPGPSPPPLAPAEQQPELPPRPPRLPERPPQRSEMPPEVPRPPQRSEIPPEIPRFPSDTSQRLPPRPPKSQEVDRALPPLPFQSSASPVGQSWYHANLKDRKVAEARLMRYSTKDGTFIVRDSSKKLGEYSLSVLYCGAVKHLRIRLRGDGKYVLGEEKPDEVPFTTVLDLVNHHKKHPLVLKSGGELKLLYECPS